MKYIILVLDGAGDEEIGLLNGKTPLEASYKPNIDNIASSGIIGKVRTIPPKFEAGSDIGNLSLLGYEEKWMTSGRGSFEALGNGVKLEYKDWAFRVNFVGLRKDLKLSKDVYKIEDFYLSSYGVEDVSLQESEILLGDLSRVLNADKGFVSNKNVAKAKSSIGCDLKRKGRINFYTGKGFKHIVTLRGNFSEKVLTAPNTFMGEKIINNIPGDDNFKPIRDIVEEAIKLFKNHPINIQRKKQGKATIDGIWLWGQGRSIGSESFFTRTGLKAIMISGVSVVRGIGTWANMYTPIIDGVTGDENTNYYAKAKEALDSFNKGFDLAYIHVEAPDELSHKGDVLGKIKSIEEVDRFIVSPILEHFKENGEDFSIMVAIDHLTYCSNGLHGREKVPFLIYSTKNNNSLDFSKAEKTIFSEKQNDEIFFENGEALLKYFLKDR